MIEITPEKITDTTVCVPGSKSYTHRLLIAAALSDGACTVRNPLDSQDTRITRRCLAEMGVAIKEAGGDLRIQGSAGRLRSPANPLDLGNSGTSMRLLAAVAALGQGVCVLTGSARMRERPIKDLLDGLNQMGVAARALDADGCPPIEVTGGTLTGGRVAIDCRISSQYLSALLLIAPFAIKTVIITVTGGLVSRPYVDMTIAVMKEFGIAVDRQGYERFRVSGGQVYRSGDHAVEPDCSQAGYFWAAAAITGAGIKVAGTSMESLQGDVRFTDCLAAMGCRVVEHGDGIEVIGGALRGVTVDMADMPDMVPTLAVVAAFARGTTVIENVAHLRAKESDRLGAVATELAKMGVNAECTGDGLRIIGGNPHGAAIDTYNDHRIAMSFALAGLKIPGVMIKDETCVKKSFPDFWKVLERLYRAERRPDNV
ncbi:MAG: 3-phosphoshikimate 1-carboxyvinyltransferase [Desulfobacterales bacterium]